VGAVFVAPTSHSFYSLAPLCYPLPVISQDLLNLLVCPKCKVPVTVSSTQTELICKGCNRAYPIRDGIPIMLIDEARPLSE
jgi:uncharacterized protein